jgi:hypothetical protein
MDPGVIERRRLSLTPSDEIDVEIFPKRIRK